MCMGLVYGFMKRGHGIMNSIGSYKLLSNSAFDKFSYKDNIFFKTKLVWKGDFKLRIASAVSSLVDICGSKKIIA